MKLRTPNKSLSTFERLSAPFTTRKFDDFDEYVSRFTTAYSRLHSRKPIYADDDFYPAVLEIIEMQKTKDAYKLENFPATIDYVGMDHPDPSSDIAAQFWSFGKHRDLEGVDSVLDILNAEKNRTRFKKNFRINGITKEEWYNDIFPKFKYSVNSVGLRTPLESQDLKPNEFIPVFGCSHTFGTGIPEEWIWHQQLNESLPIFNCGISGAGVTECYLLLKKLYEFKPFKKAYVAVPHKERFCAISKRGCVEGLLGSFIKELATLNPNQDTANMYASIAQDALELFCYKNDIELVTYIRGSLASAHDFERWAVYAPPHHVRYKTLFDLTTVNDVELEKDQYPNYVGRDLVHYGKFWHESLADHLTNK